MLLDKVKISGKVSFTLYDENMSVKEQWDVENLVVTTGLNWIAGRLDATVLPAVMSHMAIGTDATAEVLGDTALGVEIARVALTDTVNTTNSVLYTATFGPGTGTGVLREAGIFNAATAGTMLNRTTFGAQTKNSGDTLTVSWTLTIS